MSLNLAVIRRNAEQDAYGVIGSAHVLELVEAVEAAEEHLAASNEGHHWRCEFRTAAKGWKSGRPPVIECACGLDRLEAALARFDFGEAS